MPDQFGHSWTGLNPRTCRFCHAKEGSDAARWECHQYTKPDEDEESDESLAPEQHAEYRRMTE